MIRLLLLVPLVGASSCRRAVEAGAWVASPPADTSTGGLVYHKNRCFEGSRSGSRTTYAPRGCPRVDAAAAAACLARRNISRVIFVGDSITGQLWGSPLCAAPTARGLGARVAAKTFESGVITTGAVGGLEWSYVRPRGAQRADHLARTIAALPAAATRARALWVVNAGLWHLFCDGDAATAPADCVDARYGDRVAALAAAVTGHAAAGQIFWRATTAVHRENFPETMPARETRRFLGFTDANVARLNEIAADRAGAASTAAFNLTRAAGAAGHLRGDARHFGIGVLESLLGLLFLEACEFGAIT